MRAHDFLYSAEFARHQQHLTGAHPVQRAGVKKTVMNGYRRLAGIVRANRMFYRAVHHSSLLPGALLEAVVDGADGAPSAAVARS